MTMEKKFKETVEEDRASTEDHGIGTTTSIYIDPAREAAVRRKFDIYVVPVSVIYLVMSTLDRNNVSNAHLYSCSYTKSSSLAMPACSASMRILD
jgi:hypothetical protein